MSDVSLFDTLRAVTRPDFPLLQKGEDPQITFDPENLHFSLHELHCGHIKGIILTDFIENPERLNLGALRIAREIQAFTLASRFTALGNGRIEAVSEHRQDVTDFFPLAIREVMMKFRDIQLDVDSAVFNNRQDRVEIAAQFGHASCLPPAPDMHIHRAGVMHLTFGNAGLEMLVGDISLEDQAMLMKQLLEDHTQSYSAVHARPSLNAQIRTVPENWLVIQGHNFYHRSPTSVMWEGHDRLAFLSI